jgi:hypothetical protein
LQGLRYLALVFHDQDSQMRQMLRTIRADAVSLDLLHPCQDGR